MKKFLILGLSLIHFVFAYAQPSEKQRATEAFKKMTELYRSADHLSFDIIYRYADENKPGVFLDSLKGRFRMDGERYWYALDSTVCVVNKDYMVVVFKEDKIMYLSRPSRSFQSTNPLALMDSFLLANEESRVTISKAGQEERIIIEFPEGAEYKKVEYYVDTKTGYISKIRSIVDAAQLYDASARSLIDEGSSAHAIIEVSFTNYNHRSFPDQELDINNYFHKVGKEYIVTAPFESYKIFLGNPDL